MLGKEDLKDMVCLMLGNESMREKAVPKRSLVNINNRTILLLIVCSKKKFWIEAFSFAFPDLSDLQVPLTSSGIWKSSVSWTKDFSLHSIYRLYSSKKISPLVAFIVENRSILLIYAFHKKPATYLDIYITVPAICENWK